MGGGHTSWWSTGTVTTVGSTLSVPLAVLGSNGHHRTQHWSTPGHHWSTPGLHWSTPGLNVSNVSNISECLKCLRMSQNLIDFSECLRISLNFSEFHQDFSEFHQISQNCNISLRTRSTPLKRKLVTIQSGFKVRQNRVSGSSVVSQWCY